MTPTTVLRGTLDVLVLRTLARESIHGWGIAERILADSHGELHVTPGSLYPALRRLKRRKWIGSAWQLSANNRRARYYHITAAGRRALVAELAHWRRYVALMEGVLAA